MAPKSKAARQKAAREKYAERIGSFFGKVARKEESSVKEVIAVLRDFRKDLLGSIAIESFDNLPSIEATIDDRIAALQDRLDETLERQVQSFWEIGTDVAVKPVEDVLGIKISTPGPPARLLDALVASNAELVQEVTVRTKRLISNEVRQAAVGGKTPFQAQQEIVKILNPNLSDKQRKSVAARAERIVRTEMNRAYTVAQFEGMKAVKVAVPDAKKQWITTQDGRQRSSHQRVHEQIVPMGQKFKFIGRKGSPVALMFPRDPAGPSEEVVRCRCRVIVVRDDWTRPAEPKGLTD